MDVLAALCASETLSMVLEQLLNGKQSNLMFIEDFWV